MHNDVRANDHKSTRVRLLNLSISEFTSAGFAAAPAKIRGAVSRKSMRTSTSAIASDCGRKLSASLAGVMDEVGGCTPGYESASGAGREMAATSINKFKAFLITI